MNDEIEVIIDNGQDIVVDFQENRTIEASLDGGVYLYGSIKIGKTRIAKEGETLLLSTVEQIVLQY